MNGWLNKPAGTLESPHEHVMRLYLNAANTTRSPEDHVLDDYVCWASDNDRDIDAESMAEFLTIRVHPAERNS